MTGPTMQLCCQQCQRPIYSHTEIAQLMIEMGFGTLCDDCELMQLRTLKAKRAPTCTASTYQQTPPNPANTPVNQQTMQLTGQNPAQPATTTNTPNNPPRKPAGQELTAHNRRSRVVSTMLQWLRKAL